MNHSPLIDVHAHFVTDPYVLAARAAGIERPDGMPGWAVWSLDAHLDFMDRAGISKSYLSISSPGVHFGDDDAARLLARQVNEFGAALHRAHPHRFGHFASLPLPDVDGALVEAVHALDVLGSDGIAIETNAQGYYLGDERNEPLWAELDKRGALVFVHPTSAPHVAEVSSGRPRPLMEFLFDTARAATDLVFSRVLLRYPDIRWVLTHTAGVLPLLVDRMDIFRPALMPDFKGDISVREQLSGIWFDMAGSPFPRQVRAFAAAFGTERLLYGSDYCWTPVDVALAQVASIDAADPPSSSETWRELTTRNAGRQFLPNEADGNSSDE